MANLSEIVGSIVEAAEWFKTGCKVQRAETLMIGLGIAISEYLGRDAIG